MAALTRAALKALWITGFEPTQADYADFFDSYFALLDDKHIYRPETETEMFVSGTIDLSCGNAQQAALEPRYTTLVRTIPEDFDLFLEDTTGTDFVTVTFSLTGTRLIDFTGNTIPVKVSSIPSSVGSWNPVTEVLQIDAITDSIVEFSFYYDKTANVFDLKVGEFRQ